MRIKLVNSGEVVEDFNKFLSMVENNIKQIIGNNIVRFTNFRVCFYGASDGKLYDEYVVAVAVFDGRFYFIRGNVDEFVKSNYSNEALASSDRWILASDATVVYPQFLYNLSVALNESLSY